MWDKIRKAISPLKAQYLGTTNMEELKNEIINLGFIACRGTLSDPESKYFVHKVDKSVTIRILTDLDTGVIWAISVI